MPHKKGKLPMLLKVEKWKFVIKIVDPPNRKSKTNLG